MRAFPLHTDALLGEIAATQYGLVTSRQLMDLGLTRDAIERRARAGVLIRMEPDVFRLAGAPRSWQQRAKAASLWVGRRGAVARGTAAALHRLDGFAPPVVIEVTTPSSLRSRHRLTVVRRTPFWLDEDICQVAGIGVTSIERTLIDVAPLAAESRLEVALEDALRRRLTTAQKILRRLADLPINQAGRRRLVDVLARGQGEAPTDSSLEVKLARLLRDEGFPRPIRQKVLDDEGRFIGRVDFVYPERRLIVEVDGFRFHSGRQAFEKDRSRRNALTALGWMVLHATAPMIEGQERADFVTDLHRAYERRLS